MEVCAILKVRHSLILEQIVTCWVNLRIALQFFSILVAIWDLNS